MRRALTILLLCAAAALAACGGGDKKESAGTTPEPASTAPPASAGGCEQVDQPAPQERRSEKPKAKLDPAKRYRLAFTTTCGDFTVTLDPRHAPRNSASLVSLAKLNFFDGTAFHRIAPGYVIQGGDPTGTGNGDPGYSVDDKPPSDARYTKGVVAMAKTGSEPAGTGGSQFFVVLADASLPPDYAIVGRVTAGLDTVDRIGRLGGPDERPTQPVVIKNVGVEER